MHGKRKTYMNPLGLTMANALVKHGGTGKSVECFKPMGWSHGCKGQGQDRGSDWSKGVKGWCGCRA